MKGLTRMSRRPYGEGSVFAVPVESGWVAGVAARVDADGSLLGYFFGPWRPSMPTIDQVLPLDASNAANALICSGLALRKRRWLVLGSVPDWRREDWPVPAFGRREPITDRLLLVEYSDPELDEVGARIASPEEFANASESGLAGSRFVEIRLSSLVESGAIARDS